MGLEWNLLGPPIRFPIPFELSIQGLGIAGIGCVGMQISGQSREKRGDIDNLWSTQLIIFRRCFISRLVNISSRDGMSVIWQNQRSEGVGEYIAEEWFS